MGFAFWFRKIFQIVISTPSTDEEIWRHHLPCHWTDQQPRTHSRSRVKWTARPAKRPGMENSATISLEIETIFHQHNLTMMDWTQHTTVGRAGKYEDWSTAMITIIFFNQFLKIGKTREYHYFIMEIVLSIHQFTWDWDSAPDKSSLHSIQPSILSNISDSNQYSCHCHIMYHIVVFSLYQPLHSQWIASFHSSIPFDHLQKRQRRRHISSSTVVVLKRVYSEYIYTFTYEETKLFNAKSITIQLKLKLICNYMPILYIHAIKIIYRTYIRLLNCENIFSFHIWISTTTEQPTPSIMARTSL